MTVCSESFIDRAITTLREIEAGTVTLAPPENQHDSPEGVPAWCGKNVYRASNGWVFCVFDDCGEWDYFEWIESPEGERHEYPGGDDVPSGHRNLTLFERRPEKEHQPLWGYK